MINTQIEINPEFKATIESSKYFLVISDYLQGSTSELVKGLYRTNLKSKSKSFKINPYLSYFAIFVNYMKEKMTFEEFSKLSNNDRDLIYSEFIQVQENKAISDNTSVTTIRNQLQSKIQRCLKVLSLQVEQPKKSHSKGTSEDRKNKIPITKELAKMIYDRLDSDHYKLFFVFHLSTGLRFGDLNGNQRIFQNEEGYLFMRDIKTTKEEIDIPFVFFSKEFNQICMNLLGKLPQNTSELTNGKAIALSNYNNRLTTIFDELKKIGVLGKDDTISSHSLRRYCSNVWMKTNDDRLTKFMTQHSIGLESAYSEYQIFSKFKEIEEHFYITSTIVDKTNPKVEHLESENKQLKAKLETLEVSNSLNNESMREINNTINDLQTENTNLKLTLAKIMNKLGIENIPEPKST